MAKNHQYKCLKIYQNILYNYNNIITFEYKNQVNIKMLSNFILGDLKKKQKKKEH